MTQIFWRRLQKLGFRSYQEYLNSDHWQRQREAYRASGLPQQCIVCADPNYQLHHRSYVRVGCEQLLDFIPLCTTCHRKVHEYEQAHGTHVQDTHTMLRRIFKWTKGETKRRFRPFRCAGRGFRWVDRSQPGSTGKLNKISRINRRVD